MFFFSQRHVQTHSRIERSECANRWCGCHRTSIALHLLFGHQNQYIPEADVSRSILITPSNERTHGKLIKNIFDDTLPLISHYRFFTRMQIQKTNGVSKLAIPRIGCGLDGLVWDKVKDQLHEVFDGEPIEIVVYNFVSKK